MKFLRTYILTIQVSDTEAVVIRPDPQFPERILTLNFDISRNTLASANRGHFQIYNLKPHTRNQIFHDRYNTLQYRQIKLQAGYINESPLPTIFQGNILSAYSYRQHTEFMTEIEAFDGVYSMINAQVSKTVPQGWSLNQIVKSVLSTMPKVSLGAIGNFDVENSRGITLLGNSWNIAQQIATGQNANAFIDNETVNLIGKNDYVQGIQGITLITSETGLLDTPRRYDARLDARVLFEPRLVVGQLVRLQSLETKFNGQYQVIGVTHRGTISGSVCGSVETVASLWQGTSLLQGTQLASSNLALTGTAA